MSCWNGKLQNLCFWKKKKKGKKYFEEKNTFHQLSSEAAALDKILGTLELAVVFWAQGPGSQVPLNCTPAASTGGLSARLGAEFAAELSGWVCMAAAGLALLLPSHFFPQLKKILQLVKYLLLLRMGTLFWGQPQLFLSVCICL